MRKTITGPQPLPPPHDGNLIAPLGRPTSPATVDHDSWKAAHSRAGLMVNGGCSFSGVAVRWLGAMHDMVHISHGPIGCGHYALSGRSYSLTRKNGVDSFSQLHVTTDFQEKDIVFGGDKKLACALDETETMFPLSRGITVQSECPVGLIGDDIHAVAATKADEIEKPIMPVRCEGFRGGFDMWMRDVVSGWDIVSAYTDEPPPPGPYDITLMCFQPENVHSVRKLLEAIGLRVVAQWSGHGSVAELARMVKTQLVVVANLGSVRCDWVEDLQLRGGPSWIQGEFTAPAQIDTSLRAIASRFDTAIRKKTEMVIATNRPLTDRMIARYRPRLQGKLFLSLSTLPFAAPAPYQALGMRVGTAFQGWPDENGVWQQLDKPYRYRALTDDQVEILLRRAKPAVITGAGHDEGFLRKLGIQTFDMSSRGGDAPTWGYDGFARFAADMDRVVNAPWQAQIRPPWRLPKG